MATHDHLGLLVEREMERQWVGTTTVQYQAVHKFLVDLPSTRLMFTISCEKRDLANSIREGTHALWSALCITAHVKITMHTSFPIEGLPAIPMRIAIFQASNLVPRYGDTYVYDS